MSALDEIIDLWSGPNANADVARAELAALRAEVKLLTMKIVTCGVAASHPDATLTERDDYMKWDSPQAQQVRALRARVAALEKAEELLRDIAACGVSYEDERIKYVEIQVDRETWISELAPYRDAREASRE